MYEARRILEVGAAGLAAERAAPDQLATLADEVAGLFASLHDPRVFLVHDINFHRSVAAASGNPIVASLVEMVSALYYERRRDTAARASQRDQRDAAEAHRRIYQAIRARDADAARQAMHAHLLQAADYQAQEPDRDHPATRRPRRRAPLPDARAAVDQPRMIVSCSISAAGRPSSWAARAASAACSRSVSPTPAPMSSRPAAAPTGSRRWPPK